MTFDKTGYVEDDDTSKFYYEDLLKEMQSGKAEENIEREQNSFGAIHMLGWAFKPYYDEKTESLLDKIFKVCTE